MSPTLKGLEMWPCRRVVSVTILFFIFLSIAEAQEPCVPAPLFSGNAMLKMPQSPEMPNVPIGAWSRSVGDFINNDKLDLIFGSGYGSLFYFRERDNWWEFDLLVIIDLPWAIPPAGGTWPITSLTAADFNDDDKLDLAVWDWQKQTSSMQRLHVLLGNGDGTFAAPHSAPQLTESANRVRQQLTETDSLGMLAEKRSDSTVLRLPHEARDLSIWLRLASPCFGFGGHA